MKKETLILILTLVILGSITYYLLHQSKWINNTSPNKDDTVTISGTSSCAPKAKTPSSKECLITLEDNKGNHYLVKLVDPSHRPAKEKYTAQGYLIEPDHTYQDYKLTGIITNAIIK